MNGSSITGHQFYSQSDIRRLVNYGLFRGIRIIPEIDSPGHFDTRACYPNLLTVAEYPCPGAGPGKGTFYGPPDISNPELWTFFKSVYAELATLFPDPYVSLGGDEAWLTPWSCSLAVSKWMQENNISDLGAAATWYEQHLFAVVNATTAGNGAAAGVGVATEGAAAASPQHRKQTMMWAPGEQTVNSGTIHIVWTGWPQNGPADSWKNDFQAFTKLRQQTVLSGPFYLTPSHPDWNVWQNWYHTDPANFSAEFEWQHAYVLGGMGTIWSDLVKEDIMHQAWPLMNAVAEQLWSPATITSMLPGAPEGRYKDQCARLQQRGILNATGCISPPPPPPPLPPPPPPPPVQCSPHSNVKLNNTQFADGNGPRTMADAAECCQLCAQTNNCQHWSFQIDPAVSGKLCHWATLTYCCWMHSSAADAVKEVGWTSSDGATGVAGK